MNKTYKCERIRSKSDLNNNLKSLVCELKKKRQCRSISKGNGTRLGNRKRIPPVASPPSTLKKQEGTNSTSLTKY